MIADVVRPFLVQRAILFAAVGLCVQFVPADLPWVALPNLPLLDPWVRWDSGYYLLLALRGYGPSQWGDPAPFFPMYPGMIRIFSTLMPPPVAALVVANGCFLGALAVFHRFLRETDGPVVARRAVWMALVFPTSFFFSAAYSESLFLLSAVCAFWAWRREEPVIAAAAVFVGTLTRPVGLLALTLPFLLGWIVGWPTRKRFPRFAFAAIPALATLLGMHLLATGNPFEMFSAPTALHLGGKTVVETPPFWEILWDEGMGPNLARRLLNWGALILGAVGTGLLLQRRRLELATFTAIALAIPLAFHGSIFNAASMARYAAAAFPLYIILGGEKTTESSFQLRAAACLTGQVVLALLFATWRWAE